MKQFSVRILYTMLRVSNLEKSISFYCETLGMRLQRREEYPDGKFTLAFVGYGDEANESTIELTYNWGVEKYEKGNAYGHIALGVENLNEYCEHLKSKNVKFIRDPGVMKFTSPQRDRPESIAFIQDPDGYKIEIIEVH